MAHPNFIIPPYTQSTPECSRLVRDSRSGCGPLSRISWEDLASLVASNAPFGSDARDAFFQYLREKADEAYPCRKETL